MSSIYWWQPSPSLLTTSLDGFIQILNSIRASLEPYRMPWGQVAAPSGASFKKDSNQLERVPPTASIRKSKWIPQSVVWKSCQSIKVQQQGCTAVQRSSQIISQVGPSSFCSKSEPETITKIKNLCKWISCNKQLHIFNNTVKSGCPLYKNWHVLIKQFQDFFSDKSK